MRIVPLVSRKGGAGKSLLAINLAVAAWRAGFSVALQDRDPLETVTGWHGTRRRSGPLLLACGTSSPRDAARAQSDGENPDIVFVDTPSGSCADVSAALADAALCLVPVRPCEADVRAVMPTLRTLSAAGRPYALVISQAQPHTLASSGTAARSDGPVLACAVAARVDHQYAYARGLSAVEWAPQGKAAREIQSLWEEVAGRLGLPVRCGSLPSSARTSVPPRATFPAGGLASERFGFDARWSPRPEAPAIAPSVCAP